MGKGEIARDEQFLLLPQCFLLNQIFESPFVHIFDIISLFAAELEDLNIGISRKGLTNLSRLSRIKIQSDKNTERTLNHLALTLTLSRKADGIDSRSDCTECAV